MLSERIASQISEIGQSSSGKAKCEILRKVCFADLCGVSLSIELLTEPEDAGYLAAETQGLQTNISEMLRLLQNKLPSKDVDWLTEICSGVFSGKNFDDTMFNNVIAHLVQMKTGQKECW